MLTTTILCNAGLNRDQRYRTDPDAGMPMPDSMPICLTYAGLNFPLHSGSGIYFWFFWNHLARIPCAGRAGCIPFHHRQHDVQGAAFILYPPYAVWTYREYPVSLSTVSRVDVQGISVFTASRPNCRVYPSTPPTVWTCRMHPCIPPAV